MQGRGIATRQGVPAGWRKPTASCVLVAMVDISPYLPRPRRRSAKQAELRQRMKADGLPNFPCAPRDPTLAERIRTTFGCDLDRLALLALVLLVLTGSAAFGL